jgi:hypothetical protein
MWAMAMHTHFSLAMGKKEIKKEGRKLKEGDIS